MAGIFNRAIFNDAIFNTDAVADAATNIRNFSLRNWRKWKRDEDELPPIEEGYLPAPLRAEANAAVAAVANLPPARSGAALLAKMEARERYENAYREAYASEYVAQVVADLWMQDMKRTTRRRKAALLLLN